MQDYTFLNPNYRHTVKLSDYKSGIEEIVVSTKVR
nr:MAG TPA: Translation initiation factor 2 gamma of translation, GTP-binding, Initiation [Caudoviricetes sp.]